MQWHCVYGGTAAENPMCDVSAVGRETEGHWRLSPVCLIGMVRLTCMDGPLERFCMGHGNSPAQIYVLVVH